MYGRVKGYIESLADYFPDYEHEYVPKEVFLDILSTLNQELAEKFIDHAIKERNKQKVTQESKIEISAEIMEQINKKHFYSRQKGRALSVPTQTSPTSPLWGRFVLNHPPCTSPSLKNNNYHFQFNPNFSGNEIWKIS